MEKYNTPTFTPYVDITLNTITQWDPKSNSMAPIKLEEALVKSNSKNLRLSFITDGQILNCGSYPLDFAVKVVKNFHTKNYRITLSLGGAIGIFPGQNDSSSDVILKKLEKIKNTYPNCDFCLDVENTNLMTNKIQLDKIMDAFKILQKNSKNSIHYINCSLLIPVMPEGLTQRGKNVINSAYNADIDFKVNIMAIDYGAYYANKSMFIHAKNASVYSFEFLKKLKKFQNSSIGNLIEITPMIGCNDTKPLKFTLEDARNLNTWADQQKISLSYWSLTRDNAPSRGQLGQVSELHSGIEQKPYDFAHIFIGK